jgi:hypothetical protein
MGHEFIGVVDAIGSEVAPIWNVRPPVIMSTFAESFDFSGKTIHPFVTYAVSELGTTMETYEGLSGRSDDQLRPLRAR